jgi:hypothetical protein
MGCPRVYECIFSLNIKGDAGIRHPLFILSQHVITFKRLLLLFQRYCPRSTNTDTCFTAFTQVSLKRIGLSVFHLETAYRTVVNAFLAAFTFGGIDYRNYTHFTSPP